MMRGIGELMVSALFLGSLAKKSRSAQTTFRIGNKCDSEALAAAEAWTARRGEPGAGTRDINVHSVGNKRELRPDHVSIPGRHARRCNGLTGAQRIMDAKLPAR